MPKTNRWHPVMLPDDYLRKLKQDLAEAAAAADGFFLELFPDEVAEQGCDEPSP